MRRLPLILLLCGLVAGCPERSHTPERHQTMTPKATPATIPPKLTPALASSLVRRSLKCVGKEYPNKLAVVLSGEEVVRSPRSLFPAFYGCFDWHSAVHGHWAMARILTSFADLPEAPRLRKTLGEHLTEQRLQAEVRTFKEQRLLERPYGWAWLLRLAAELRAMPREEGAASWARALRPLESLLARRTQDYLKRLSLPVRAGTHNSTAFALVHVLDYARVAGDAALARDVEAAARRFYLEDSACPVAYEPSGEDFVSPCLAEADLMRRVLSPAELRPWLDRFLPGLKGGTGGALFSPPRVLDPEDPKIGHLIGLDFHRAWCMRGLASALGPDDPRSAPLEASAGEHATQGLKLMNDSGYGGAHWLASFAIYLLTDVGL